MSFHPTKTNLTYEECEKLIHDEVFRLRPSDYGVLHPKWPGLVGLELEMVPLRAAGGRPVSLFGELAGELLALADEQESWTPEYKDSQLQRIALGEGDQLTFEPGGQLEISSKPYPCLSEAVLRLREVRKALENRLNPKGFYLLQHGVNPFHSPEELGLQLQKPRYQAMTRYFQGIGGSGPRMMRQTCTLQINLDFGPDETSLARRFLGAYLLSPFATAIFANSPVLEGARNGFASGRARIWQDTDPGRTGFPSLAGVQDKQSAVAAYLDFAMEAPVMFMEGAGHRVPEGRVSFSEWISEGIDNLRPDLSDFRTHLSLLFPEVRPRGFLELRSVDCQSRVWQSVPAAFFTGALYDERALEEILALLSPFVNDLPSLWRRSAHGPGTDEFGDRAEQLMRIALEGYGRLAPCFREECPEAIPQKFHERFTARRRCPADDLLDLVRRDGFDNSTLFRLEEAWEESVVC